MKKLSVIICVSTFLLFFSCTTASNVVTSTFWVSEQTDAISYLDAQEVASASFRLRRTINNAPRYFSYEGYLFSQPIRPANSEYQISRGLINTNFPRRDSSDWMIMFESINDLRLETGGQNGDYFIIYIRSITRKEFDSGEGGSLIMFVIGRFEPFGNISGQIWRIP